MALSQPTMLFNKIIFDTLVRTIYNIYSVENIQNMMESLLDNITVYNYEESKFGFVIHLKMIMYYKIPNLKYKAELDDVLWLIVEETEQVICSWLGLLDLILVILIFYAQSIVLKIIETFCTEIQYC